MSVLVDHSGQTPSFVFDLAKGSRPETAAISALLVSNIEEDHRFMADLFFQKHWTLFQLRTLPSARSFLRESSVPIIVGERDLPDGGWKELLAAIEALARPPLLVVASCLADEYLWAEVLNLGGHDVLAKPFQTKELVWVVENAWRWFRFLETGALEEVHNKMLCNRGQTQRR